LHNVPSAQAIEAASGRQCGLSCISEVYVARRWR